jgi:UDP-N-acetylmuramoylalanine--D-glutamate ligase
MAENGEHILPGSHAAAAQLGDVLVLGLGKSGCAAADYLLDRLGGRVSSVTIAAGPETDCSRKNGAAFQERGARVLFDHYDIRGRYDLCIASPGISQFEDFYRSAQAACGEVVSEVEFAWRESALADRWVGITGTNGKTTTT